MLIGSLTKAIFGSRNQRTLRRLGRLVAKINALEDHFLALSDDELKAKTTELQARFTAGETLTALLPEAFATTREAARRVLGMRHFDVQLIGGMVLHEGSIAEMRTGEGKTLMATLPVYLNALTGKGVHVITVNDYLAQRDAGWMRPVYDYLGMTTGIVVANMSAEKKRAAYACDIVYGTNNEFGFDYLRDNMAFRLEDRVQRDLHFAVVDEVDSILIDEARTPLIISGPAEDSSAVYQSINRLIPNLTLQKDKDGPGDYSLDEKNKQAYLTEDGHSRVEEWLSSAGVLPVGTSLYDVANVSLMHHVYAALRAHTLYHKDVDYIIENNEIVIIDEHTGRKMQGRRWSDGLHQAVEAKEGVTIQHENQTLASITFQNYFRLYDKLSGMTGTADTEAYEFRHIYGLDVVVIPTNRDMVRKDYPDFVYVTQKEKFTAIISDIKTAKETGQPVLVGTASIETSEYLSTLLQQENIPHQVLNAKFHEKEAHIIAQAGLPGAVTIATNMAGRGTDIVLGGNLKEELKTVDSLSDADIEQRRADWKIRHDAVVASGGLRVIGSERHESRRIDNQLRGRSGRQGDPGSSRFYLSLEDNLLRIFAAGRMQGLMRRVGMKDGDALESQLLSRVIENAQRKVEGFHFDIRKQLLEFDDVANDQRKVIYQQRTELMGMSDVHDVVESLIAGVMTSVVRTHIPDNSMPEQWDIDALEKQLAAEFNVHLPLSADSAQAESVDDARILEQVQAACETAYAEKETLLGVEVMRGMEKTVMLQVLDTHWREHINALDHLRQGIHLRGYAQKNPKQEYKREAFELFAQMLLSMKKDVLSLLLTLSPARAEPPAPALTSSSAYSTTINTGKLAFNEDPPASSIPFSEWGSRVARNALCPCGSGERYKQCHGKVE